MERKLIYYIEGFEKFMKEYAGKKRKKLTEAQLTSLFMRKIMESPGFMTYLKIKNDDEKEMQCIFGVKETS